MEVCARALQKGGALKLRGLEAGEQGVAGGELGEVNRAMHGGLGAQKQVWVALSLCEQHSRDYGDPGRATRGQ